ncbi:Alpha amylase, catalytic domain containing protein [Histomonas meleagridis]|uniref:Alpha amylase, catalytic domain containing protein n=1 Tax=Histomonas meleagridis TaxID=135588 RepID=UPI00355AB171|nr:Alpha amylase, catalytic domain containing protein [Histomonas meleagridis]
MEQVNSDPLLSEEKEPESPVSKVAKGAKSALFKWVTGFCVVIGVVAVAVTCYMTLKPSSSSQKPIQVSGQASNTIPNSDVDFNSLIIYQVMVSSFQGDGSSCYCTGYGPSSHKGNLKGIINSLDYIKGLGAISALIISMLIQKFGTNDDLRRLIQEAHNRGLYVFLDGVFGHHGGNVKASPNGNYPQGGSNPVSYPGSLEFYKEVATYWINNYEIDGWRLDQCYQMYQNNHNYWNELRTAVESACQQRKNQGKQWGILGYMVGEAWKSQQEIQQMAYSQGGLRSAFDFPSRYEMVKVLAEEESTAGGYDVSNMLKIYKTPAEKGYSHDLGEVYPNLFITNHDLWRFGNLVKGKYGYGKENEAYWKRHKIALSSLTTYTGPITIYYGDEIGDLCDCWPNCGTWTIASDNVGRTDGKITGFDSNQQALHDYTAKLIDIRKKNAACWRGTNSAYTQNGVLVNIKYDQQTNNKIVYVVNTGTSDQSLYVACGGSQYRDLISGGSLVGSGGFNINAQALTSYIILVE